jgi:hypothetical protein
MIMRITHRAKQQFGYVYAFTQVCDTFPDIISTDEVIAILKKPENITIWSGILSRYPDGGKGCGFRHTAFKHVTNLLKKNGYTRKTYIDAPETWGSPLVAVWSRNKI